MPLWAHGQTYQTCPMVPSYDSFGNPVVTASGTPVLVPDPSCVNANKDIAYSSGQSTAGSFILSGTTVVNPAASCGTPGTTEYTNCVNAYNANVLQNQSAAPVTVTTAQQALYTVSDTTSAYGVLSQMIDANQMGQQSYIQTSNDASVAGASKLVLAGECASTCTASGTSTGCCSESAQYYASGAGYLLSQRQAETQSLQHYNAAYTSCDERNKILSGDPVDCSSLLGSSSASSTVTATTTTSGITISLMSGGASTPVVFNPLTGSCTPPNSATCKSLVSNVGAAPPSVRQAIQNKGLKNSKVDIKTLYKNNVDGSIGVGNGKSFSAKDFVSSVALMAKGFTSATASKIFGEITSLTGLGNKDVSGTALAKTKGASDTLLSMVTEGIGSGTTSGTVTGKSIMDCSIQVVEYEDEYIGAHTTDVFHTINCGYKREYYYDNFIKSEK